jgi:cytochrome c
MQTVTRNPGCQTLAILSTTLMLAAPAAADPAEGVIDAALARDGDVGYGEYLAGECVTCHQLSGEDNCIPSVVGWPKEVFVRALVEYKTKARPHEAMQTVTSALGSEEIAALAAYFEAVGGNR